MMTQSDWDETAKGLAGFVHNFRVLVERGAIPLRFRDDAASIREEARSPLVVGVFGNDNDQGPSAGREVELIRDELKGAALEELGFGLNEDGSSWAMVIGAGKDRFQTVAGKVFHRELLQIFLEDLVWRAWRSVNPPETDAD
jgi:hypothetical protein